jgi:hypothetical protein
MNQLERETDDLGFLQRDLTKNRTSEEIRNGND